MPMFGGDSTKTSDEEHQDHSDAVIDPALRKRGQDHHQDHQPSMPTRVEPSFQMSSPFVSPALCSDARLFNVSSLDRRRQHHHFDTPNTTRGPSPPPPIATIPNSHSPSPSVVSVDRSSNSTPHIRRSPPESMQPVMYSSSYHDPRQQHHQQQHPYAREPINHHPHPHQYMYTPHHPPPFDPQPRYDHPQHPHDSYSAPPGGHFAVPAMSHPPPQMHAYGRQYPLPGQAPVTIVHTDDAATKLTDGIRRRCFNCCTTDTSTWRRSNLSPGKVLCNKCGLFERTHSRPRPDQFPHKRGPLASSVMRGRTPPGSLSTSLSTSGSTQLPPISATAPGPYTTYHHMGPGEYPHPSQGQQGPGQQGQQQQQQQGLPGLQSWSTGNTSTGSSSAANGVANGSSSSTPTGAGATTTSGPGQRAPQESPRLPNNSSSSASASSRGGGKYDYEELSSNAADRSHPPSPPSRSSTAAGTKATAVVNGSGGADGAESKPASREA